MDTRRALPPIDVVFHTSELIILSSVERPMTIRDHNHIEKERPKEKPKEGTLPRVTIWPCLNFPF